MNMNVSNSKHLHVQHIRHVQHKDYTCTCMYMYTHVSLTIGPANSLSLSISDSDRISLHERTECEGECENSYAYAYTCTCMYMYSRHQKKVPVSVPFRSVFYSVPFRSVFHPVFAVPFRSIPFRSVHFRSNRLPRANSFSARHEFVCKIHCVRWSIDIIASVGEALRDYFQRLDQEMVFFYHEKGYRPHPIALFIAGVRAGPRGDGSARAYLYFLRFIIECTCTTSLGSLLVATDSPFLLQTT